MSDTHKSNPQSDPMREAFDKAGAAFRDAADPRRVSEAQAAMGMDPAKMQETLKAMTERSMEQSREAYQRMRSAADEASRSLETTLESAHGGSMALSRKAIETMRTNAEMGFAHLEKLASAKSMAEMIELQTGFVRQQIELAGDQAREIQSLSQRVAEDLMRPGSEAMKKATSGQP